jgi:hypothetical protein
VTVTTPAHNHDLTVEFLHWWLPNGPWCLAAIHPDQRDKKTFLKAKVFWPADGEAALRSWLEEHKDHNLYFTANLAKADAKGSMRPTREDLVGLVCLHADIDPRVGEDLASEQTRIRELLTQPRPKDLPPPTVIVATGGGFQALWRLREVVPIKDGAHADDLSRYNLQIRNLLEGDSAQDVSRILRLPGTVNWPSKLKLKKGRVPAVATIVSWNKSRAYDLKDFIPAPEVQMRPDPVRGGLSRRTRPRVEVGGNIRRLEDVNELPESVPGVVKVIIVQGDNPDNFAQFNGDRSKAVWYVTCELVRHKVPDDVIFSVLTDPGFGISGHVLDQPRAEKYALRQIERAHEHAIDPDLRALNERFAVVTNFGGKCRIIEEVYDERLRRGTLTTLSFEDMRNAFLNQQKALGNDEFMPLAEWWLRNANRRQYDRIVFQPNEDEEINGCYNLWRGFGFDPAPGECGLFLDHIRNVLCGGDEAIYLYVLRWMARAVQRPGEAGQVAMVLKGRMGTGKSFFAKTFGRLFGRHYLAVSDSKRLVSNFNSHLRDCVVLFADEAFYAGDKKHESILKALITEDTLAIEAKGKDIEMGANCLHVIMASNEDWAVPAAMDDRRFLVLDVTDERRNAHNYFQNIQKQLDEGGYAALLDLLMKLDITKFNVRERPETSALATEKEMSLGPVESYWYECLRNGSLGLLGARNDDWPKLVPRVQLYDEVRRRSGNHFKMSNIALASIFSKKLLPRAWRDVRISGRVTWRDAQNNERTATNPIAYEIGSLAACRKHWEKRYGAPANPWPGEETDESSKLAKPDLPF